MFENLSFGRYIPLDSPIHRLDPRVKFLSLLSYIILILIISNLPSILAAVGLLALLCFLSKIRTELLLASLKPMLPLLIIAFVLNLLMPGSEELLLRFYFIRISSLSLQNAVLMTVRVASLILASNLLLSMTTTAMQLCDGMEALFSPLRRFGVPVQDISMMMSIALRFIPTLIEESDKIMKAQSSRGANFDTGGFFRRVRGLIAILIPLFVSSFRRAEELAVAMEARSYRGASLRTKMNPLKIKRSDGIFILFFALALALLVALNLL